MGASARRLGAMGWSVVAVGGWDTVSLLAAAQARVLHQTGNPAATMPTPPGTERRHDARTAVGLATLLVTGRDLRGQRLIFQGPRSGHRLPLRPSVVAAGGTPQDSRRVARWNGQSSSPAPEPSVRRRCGENAQRFLEYRAARAGGGSRAGRPPVGPVDPWPCRPWTRRPPSPRRRPGPGGCARHIAAWHSSPVRGRRRQRTCRCSASWRPPPV